MIKIGDIIYIGISEQGAWVEIKHAKRLIKARIIGLLNDDEDVKMIIKPFIKRNGDLVPCSHFNQKDYNYLDCDKNKLVHKIRLWQNNERRLYIKPDCDCGCKNENNALERRKK